MLLRDFVSVRVCAYVIVGYYSSRNQEYSLKDRGAIQLIWLFFILLQRVGMCNLLLLIRRFCSFETIGRLH